MAKYQSCQWKRNLIRQLKTRNAEETRGFIGLIDAHNKLFEQISTLKSKNVHLTVETEKLKEENLALQIRGENGRGGGEERHQALEQEVYNLQKELTALHRERGEIIELLVTLKAKKTELDVKEASINDLIAREFSLKEEIKHLEHTIAELEATNQTLIDMRHSSQMALTSLEKKHRQLQEENRELKDRWQDYEDKINKQKKQQDRIKQRQLQRELEEAAKEHSTHITEPKYLERVSYCASQGGRVFLPNKVQTKLVAHDGEVNAVLWSPSGSVFATGGSDSKVRLWKYTWDSCKSKGTLLGSNAGLTSLDFSCGPDEQNSLLLGASNDHASHIWALADQRLRCTLTGHRDRVLSAKFLGDSFKVVSGGYDYTLKIWDVQRTACIKTISAASRCNDLVTLHGHNIISGHYDRKIKFWDSRSESITNEIILQGRICSLALHPDKMSILVCCSNNTLQLVDLRNNQVSNTLRADKFTVTYLLSRAVFSPDGSYAAAGSYDGTLYIWNTQNGKVERTLKEHSDSIIACSWHPTGPYLLSSDKQKKVVLWSD